jgi:hypothetical protein
MTGSKAGIKTAASFPRYSTTFDGRMFVLTEAEIRKNGCFLTIFAKSKSRAAKARRRSCRNVLESVLRLVP